VFGVLFFSLCTSIGFAQSKTKSQFSLIRGTEENPDVVALKMVSAAYVARVCDDYMPWWQADLLALSSTVVWEFTDHLFYGKTDGFRSAPNNHGQNLHNAAIGILLNRAMPMIISAGPQFIKSSIRNNFSLKVDSREYPKVLLAMKLK